MLILDSESCEFRSFYFLLQMNNCILQWTKSSCIST